MTTESVIVDVTPANLQQLLQTSMQTPVILDFWADWCQPCKQLTPVLEKLVTELAGRVLLGKVNADEQQELAARFGVRSLPTLKLVFQGRLVDELSGLQTEAALRQWLAPVLAESDPEAGAEAFLEQVRLAIEHGHGSEAEAALRDALLHEPSRHPFRAALVEYLLGEGRLDEAQSVLAEIVEDVAELRPFRARFALLAELTDAPIPLAELAARIAASPVPDDLYQYGLRAAAAGQFEAGLTALLQMLRDHRNYGDGLARAALLKVFDCLPKGDPLASEYRRKMFNYLH
ncbi:MAG: tetratricopeptide repeat protein [Alcanivoracaceae bacterium]